MTGIDGYASLIRSHTSKPLMSGSRTSSTTRSMCSRATRSSAAVPFSASTVTKPARVSQLTSRYRLGPLSSTTSTVTGPPSTVTLRPRGGPL